MAQKLIDFGSFPDDPTADAIRTAFMKVQENFTDLYSGAAGQAVFSVNRTPGAGITVNSPVGNVVVTANIACVQVETSTLSIGITANGANTAVYTSSNQILVIDLPDIVDGITDVLAYGNVLANRVTANIDMYTPFISVSGNANVGNLHSANNITGTNLNVVNGILSGNVTVGNIEVVGCVESSLIPCPPDSWTLGNSTNNWDNLYTQDIIMGGIPVQAIGYVSPSFGNVYLGANVTVTGTSSATATTVLTFTVPNSGYYRINTLLIAQPGTGATSPISFGVFDQTGTLVPNSEILCTTTSSAAINQNVTGAGVIDLQINGVYTYTIRAWGAGTPSILTYGGNGQSSVNWLRLDPVASISTTSNATFGNLTILYHSNLNTVSTLNNVDVGGNFSVSGNAIISGNLTVDGNLIYVNVEDLSIEDPIIQLQTGPNGSPLVSNSGKDVGVAMNYYTSTPKVAWMGWDTSNVEISLGEDVTIAGEVVSYTKLANVRAGNFIGTVANGSSNMRIYFNNTIEFSANGNANVVTIDSPNTYINNQLWANSNIYIKNVGTGPSLYFQDDVGTTGDTFLQYYNPTDSVILTVNNSNVWDANISNTFFNSPLTANANIIVNNAGLGGKITFIDDVSTNTDTSIAYVNASDSIVIKVNNVDSIQSNAQGVNVTGNVVISGNLEVNGNITYINTETLEIEDPIIQLQVGPNGAKPVANSGKDVGSALNYFDAAARVAFMGWDTSNVEFGFASRSTITNEIVAFDVYANVRSGNFIGTIANGTSNIQIDNNANIKLNAPTIELNGCNLVTNCTSFSLINTVATTVQFAGAANVMTIGANGSSVTFRGNINLDKSINFVDANGITTDTSIYYIGGPIESLVVALNNSSKMQIENGQTVMFGNVVILNGNIDTTSTTINIANANSTTINFGGAGTAINVGASTGNTTINHNLIVKGNTIIDTDLSINGCDLTTNCTTFNLINANATTVYFAGAASNIIMGATGGNVRIRGNVDLDKSITFLDSNGANLSDTSIYYIGGPTEALVVALNNSSKLQIENGQTVMFGNLVVVNGNIDTTSTTINIANANSTTINFGGAATTIEIGAATGNTNINHNLDVDGNVNIDSQNLTTSNTTFNIANANATTINFAGAGTNVNIGATTGNTTVKNNLVVDGNITVTQDFIIKGCDFVTDCTTFNLINANATTIQFGGAASNIIMGATGGNVRIRGNVDLDKSINFADANGITTDTSVYYIGGPTEALVVALNNSSKMQIENGQTVLFGNVVVQNGNIDTTSTTINIANANSTTINFGGAATTIEIGAATGNTNINHNLDVDGNVNIDSQNLTTSNTTFNIANANATTVNFAGAGTNVNIGSGTGNTTINHNLIVKGNTIIDTDLSINGCDLTTNCTTFNLINANATTVQFGGAASNIIMGATGGNVRIRGNVDLDKSITFKDANGTTTDTSIYYIGGPIESLVVALNNSSKMQIENGQTVMFGNLVVVNGNVDTTSTTINIANANSTTINFGGAATTVEIGAATGNTNINHNLDVDGNVNIDSQNLTTSNTTFNIANANATTVNFAGAGSNINIGASTGNTTINHNLIVKGNTIIDTDLAINGCDLTTNCTTFNLINANATTVQFGGAATAMAIGANGSAITFRGNISVDKSLTFADANGTVGDTSVYYIGGPTESLVVALNNSSKLQIENGQTVLFGNVVVQNGNIDTTSTTINIANANSTTINFGGAATTIEIGAATGNTNINHNLDVDGNVNIDSQNLTTSNTTFNIANANATTINFGGAATTVEIGAATGNTNINHNLDVDGNVNIDSQNLTTSNTTFNIANANATTINFGGAATTVEIGAATGNTNINHNLDVDGNVNIDSQNLTTSNTTFNIANANATTVNFAGAATTINMGNSTGQGNTNIRHNLVVTGNTVIGGDLTLDGCDLNTNCTSFNLLIANTTELFFASAATEIEIAAITGNTNIRNTLDVWANLNIDGDGLTVTKTSFTIANANATTINFAGAGTNVNIGASTGNTTVKNNLVVDGNITVTQDFVVKGCDFVTDCTTFSLVNANATTVNFAGAGTNVNIGATTGNTNIKNNLILSGNANIVGNTSITGDLQILGCDLTTNCTSFNLINANATTVYFAGAATTIEIGAATGNTNINHNLDVDGNINIDGTALTVTQSTFNLANANVDTLYIGGEASSIIMGNVGVGLEVLGNINLDKSINFTDANGVTTDTSIYYTGSGEEAIVMALNNTSKIQINNGQTVMFGNLVVANGNIDTSTTTLNIANANSTTVNFAGAGTNVNIGAGTGNTTVNHNLIVKGNTIIDTDLAINGCDLTTNCTSFNLINANATTVYFAGAASNVYIGANGSNTTLAGNILVDRSITFNDGNGTATDTKIYYIGTGIDALVLALNNNPKIQIFNDEVVIKDDLEVQGNIDVANTTINLANANATTINFGGAASNINMGATGGKVTITGNLGVDKSLNFIDNTGANNDTSVFYRPSPEGLILQLNGSVKLELGTDTSNLANVNTFNILANTTNFPGNLNIGNGNLIISSNGEIYSNGLCLFNLPGNVQIGGNIAINGGDITSNKTTFNILPANTTTINFGNVATNVNIGSSTGNTTVKNNLVVDGNANIVGNTSITGDLALNGCDLTTTCTTFNLVNANATTVNFAGAGSNINIGANGSNTTFAGNIKIDRSITFKDGNSTADDTKIFYIGTGIDALVLQLNNNQKIQIFNDEVVIKDDLEVQGNIDVPNTTFGLANANATTIQFGGAATEIAIGATGSNVNFRGNITIDKSMTFIDANGANSDTSIYYIGGGEEAIVMALNNSSKIQINNGQTVMFGNMVVVNGNVDVTNANLSLANANATNIQFGGAASNITMGATGSFTTIRGNVYVGANGFIGTNSNYAIVGGELGVVLGQGTTYPGNGILVVDGFGSAVRPRHNEVFTLGTTSNRWTTTYTANLVTEKIYGTPSQLSIYSSVGGTLVANATSTNFKTLVDLDVNGKFNVIAANGFVYTQGNVGVGGKLDVTGLIAAGGNVTGANLGTPGGLFVGGNAQINGNLSTTQSIYTGGSYNGNAAGLTNIPAAQVTGKVANAVYADSAGSATTATTATNATNAGYASSAGSAGYASTAGCANSMCADVAEYYLADDEYDRGTVLEYGGNYEVTLSSSFDSHRFAGVVSTNPAVIMNNGIKGDHPALLALIGRVPVKVKGNVQKGDLMVSAPGGYAVANNHARAGTIIGKSLENFTGESGMIEVVVGRN